jgi:hypothetical protein
MRVLIALVLMIMLALNLTDVVAQSREEIAGKIVQADREVHAYQKAKANGTYVDYSVTPTWVNVFWSVVGIGIFGGLGVAFWLSWRGNPDAPPTPFTPEKQEQRFQESAKFDAFVAENDIQNMSLDEIAIASGLSYVRVRTRMATRKLTCRGYGRPG